MAADLAALPDDVAHLIAERTRGWPAERKAELATEIRRQAARTSPGTLAAILDPQTVQTPALALIDQALLDVDEGRCKRLIISLPPQEGKSTRVARYGSLWALLRNPDRRVGIASYSAELAAGHGRFVRGLIETHGADATDAGGTDLLGLRISKTSWAAGRWDLADHRGGLLAAGLRGGWTGKPLGWLTIDDPFKDRAEADSPVIREFVWEWWTNVVIPRLAPDAPVIVVMTRWHEDDLVGRLTAEDAALPETERQWRVITIPAECEDEQADPLGRRLGEFLRSARGRTVEQWRKIKTSVGARVWAALYQGRPTPAEGGIFRWDWIRPFRARAGELPDMAKTVVAVDTTGGGHDEAGVMTMGRGADRRSYLLADRSGAYTLGGQWRVAWLACLDDEADALVYEGNFVDTAMRKAIPQAWKRIVQQARALDAADALLFEVAELEQVLRQVADQLSGRLVDPDAYTDDEAETPDGLVEQLRALLPYVVRVLRSPEQGPCRVERVWASKGKRTRAEPTATAYETGQVSHAGVFPALEQQMVTWQEGQDSPNRVDALVWAWTALNSVGGPARASAPSGSIQTGPAGLVRR